MKTVVTVIFLSTVAVACGKKEATPDPTPMTVTAASAAPSAAPAAAGTIQITGTGVAANPVVQLRTGPAGTAAVVGANGAKVQTGPGGAGTVAAGGAKVTTDSKGGSTVVVPGVGTIKTPAH